MSQVLKRFEWLLSFLIISFKFVHTVLGMMRKVPNNKIETMGVRVVSGGRFELHYNPDFTEKLSDEELVYVFYHEILHLVLHHCTRRKFDLHELGNIACDLAVNELIPETNSCKKPSCGVFVDDFKKNPLYNDIQNKQTAEWYYDYLKDKHKNDKSGDKGDKGEGLGETIDDHSGWDENEIADERVRAKVKEIQDNSLWGNISQTDIEVILAAQVRRINWRNKIRVWFGNQVAKYRNYTRKKPNRRTGYIHPGTKKVYTDKWLVAADTSGSIDSELLAQWLGVVNQLVDEIPLDFMQFDWEKTEEPRPFDRRRVSLEFKGRGGTNFQPVIDIVNKYRYKGVMILTDGEAAEPTKPTMTKVLWVLPSGKYPPVDWGERVYLERHV